MNEVEKDLYENGMIYIYGSIDYNVAEDFHKKMTLFSMRDDLDRVLIYINSRGGYTDALFSMLDMMNACPHKIVTVSLGTAMSSGFMLLIAGDERIITPNTYLMCHRFWKFSVGDHAELIAAREGEDFLHDRMIKHIINHSNFKTKKEVETNILRESDKYILPKQAEKWGLVDKVVKGMKASAKVVNK